MSPQIIQDAEFNLNHIQSALPTQCNASETDIKKKYA